MEAGRGPAPLGHGLRLARVACLCPSHFNCMACKSHVLSAPHCPCWWHRDTKPSLRVFLKIQGILKEWQDASLLTCAAPVVAVLHRNATGTDLRDPTCGRVKWLCSPWSGSSLCSYKVLLGAWVLGDGDH